MGQAFDLSTNADAKDDLLLTVALTRGSLKAIFKTRDFSVEDVALLLQSDSCWKLGMVGVRTQGGTATSLWSFNQGRRSASSLECFSYSCDRIAQLFCCIYLDSGLPTKVCAEQSKVILIRILPTPFIFGRNLGLLTIHLFHLCTTCGIFWFFVVTNS
jgi:hypothetical protein